MPYTHWTHPKEEQFETIWITIRPHRMPRDISNITVIALYHPPQANHRDLKMHLCSGIDHILCKHPSSGLFVIGDFNQFPDGHLTSQYRLKQMVKTGKRGEKILDKCYSNAAIYYEIPRILPQVGKSDHNIVFFSPAPHVKRDKGTKIKTHKRIQGRNEKALFVNALQTVDWSPLFTLESCAEQFNYFNLVMSQLIDTYLPIKEVTIHTNDKPWVTDSFKDLIIRRQAALSANNRSLYNRLRNKINRQSKLLSPRYYHSKVKHLKASNPKKWWSNVKDIVGMNKMQSADTLTSMANDFTNGCISDLVTKINEFLQSVTSDINPLQPNNQFSAIHDPIPTKYTITVQEVERNLMRIKPGKSPGPDGIQAWMLRDLAPMLAPPVTAIFNSSIRDAYVPPLWKSANICPLPKKNPPKLIEKDIRPISLTPLLAKELERFVAKWLREEIGDNVDPLQFGNRRQVSTTHMLVH